MKRTMSQTLNCLVLACFFICTLSIVAGEGADTNKTHKVSEETSSPKNYTVYPVSGFEGKTVRVKIVNQSTEDSRIVGPFDSPKELIVPWIDEGTYLVRIEVYDPDTKKWKLVSSSVRWSQNA